MAEETPELPEAPEAFKWVPWMWHHTKANREAFMKPAVWALVVLVGFFAYRIGVDHSEEIVGIKNERISQLNEQLVAYKDRLQGASPDQAAKQIKELQEKISEQTKKLDSILDDRALSLPQEAKFVELCKPFGGTDYDAAFNLGDVEGFRFLEKIEVLLAKANWKEQDWTGGTLVSPRDNKPTLGNSFEDGVLISYIRSSEGKLKQPAEALNRAFILSNIASRVTAEEDDHNKGAHGLNLDVGRLHVMVGHKSN